MSLLYPNDSESDLIIGHAYTCYLSYSHNITMVDHKQDICSHVVAQ